MNCQQCGAVLNIKCSNCLRCGAPNHYYQGYTQMGNNNNFTNVNVNMNTNVYNNDNMNPYVNNNFNYDYNSVQNSQMNIESKKDSNLEIIMFVVLNIIGFTFLLLAFSASNTIENEMIYAVISTIMIYFYFICYQLLLIKARLPWWGIFIPIYNLYLLNKLSFGNGWLFLTPVISFILCVVIASLGPFAELAGSIISIVIFIYPVAMQFCLGKRFGRSGIMTLLFGFIIIPSIALSKKYQCEY